MKSKYIPVALLIIAAAAAVFALSRYSKPQAKIESTESMNPESTKSPSLENTKNFTLEIKNKKLTGDDVLKVTEGDNVVFNIIADQNEELHLHGYDKSVEFKKDEPAKLEFTANLTGRFPFEMENSKTDLGALEVTPK